MSKRRILLVDDEIAVLLTLKTVLEISGFDVDTAASAREARHKLKARSYEMVITDMRMESDEAGREVIAYARTAEYHPAVALLTAFPDDNDNWQDMGADKMLVKPMQTRSLIQSIEKLLTSHEEKLRRLEKDGVAASLAAGFAAGMAAGRTGVALDREDSAAEGGAARSKKPLSKKLAAQKLVAQKPAVKKTSAKSTDQRGSSAKLTKTGAGRPASKKRLTAAAQ